MTRESSELFHRVAIKGEGDELAREGRRERERRVRGETEEEEKEKRERDGGAVTQKREGEREARANRLCDRLFFWQLYSSVKRIRALFTSYLFLS